MADTKTLNIIRAAFMRRASAPDINALALKLAYLIAYSYMDSVTGKTRFVAQEEIAGDLNVTARTVRTLLDILQPFGLVIAAGHGPGRASRYWIDPDKATSNRKPASGSKRKPASSYKRKSASGSEPPTGNLTHPKRKSDASQAEASFHPSKKNLQEETPREEDIYGPPGFAAPDSKQDAGAKGDRKTRDDNIISDPKPGRTAAPKAGASSNLYCTIQNGTDPAGADPDAAVAGEIHDIEKSGVKDLAPADPDADQASDENRSDEKNGATVSADDLAAAFAEFWLACPRKVAEEKTRKAFVAAMKRGVDPGKIVGAMQRYAVAVARAGKKPEHIKLPFNWLNDGYYDETSSAPKTIDHETGEEIEPPRPSRPRTDEENEEQIRAENNWDLP